MCLFYNGVITLGKDFPLPRNECHVDRLERHDRVLDRKAPRVKMRRYQ